MSFLALLCTLAYPTVESDQFPAEQQHKALSATVRILLPDKTGEGTGAIVSRRGNLAYVLTANHVVERLSNVNIQTFSDASYPKPDQTAAGAEVWTRWPNEDLALLRAVIPGPTGVLRVCPRSLAPKGDKFPVMSVGCTNGAEPTCEIDRLLRIKAEVNPNRPKQRFWESGKASVVGRSGGPLIDRRGYLVGICSGKATTKSGSPRGFYVHLDDIYEALDREVLTWVYADEPKKGK